MLIVARGPAEGSSQALSIAERPRGYVRQSVCWKCGNGASDWRFMRFRAIAAILLDSNELQEEDFGRFAVKDCTRLSSSEERMSVRGSELDSN